MVTRIVSLIRPTGPAAKSGLRVGDVIVSVDGQDVRGANDYLYAALLEVRTGTTVTLGLGRGDKVTITAGKPL
jgi:S1-C subfamily serine protease